MSRTVVEINAKHHPEGKRFLIKEYPKDKEYRRFKLSPQIAAKLKQHIEDSQLERDDLLFIYQTEEPAPQAKPEPVEHLGLTEPNAAGRRYRHGTLSAYSAGKCRCQHCKNAYLWESVQHAAYWPGHFHTAARLCPWSARKGFPDRASQQGDFSV
ncbi:hypothetical protein [Planotetraspora kaengkrachanensis]|uniref:Uncharacterized protein n=1 Tax=Planotetraspora kaengkrachanensis TaxID=575193 RepID=A0A8J3Q016_9ACTN|nr:hypothetical protein [Planotetraspora kaengkrachanensis]GIG84257.1 hypothetical protein Pka01_73840 [Planotetraspora kaengkrachanensis]